MDNKPFVIDILDDSDEEEDRVVVVAPTAGERRQSITGNAVSSTASSAIDLTTGGTPVFAAPTAAFSVGPSIDLTSTASSSSIFPTVPSDDVEVLGTTTPRTIGSVYSNRGHHLSRAVSHGFAQTTASSRRNNGNDFLPSLGRQRVRHAFPQTTTSARRNNESDLFSSLGLNPQQAARSFSVFPPAARFHTATLASQANLDDLLGEVLGHRGQPPTPRATATSSSTRKRKSPPEPSYLPMQKGKEIAKLTGFDALQIYYPQLKANDRTTVLFQLLPTNYSRKWTQGWRVAFEKQRGSGSTLWELVRALGDEISKKNVIIPEQSKAGKYKGEPDTKPKAALKSDTAQESPKASGSTTVPIGPLSGEVLDSLYEHFRAYVNRAQHKIRLEAIKEVEESADSLMCGVCTDSFQPSDIVACNGDEELHFFCKTCFVNYVTVTVESGPIQSIKCPNPQCQSLFATADVKLNLSDWDLLMIDHRETSRDRRVALAAKAVLHCICGAVGIVTDELIGNGRIACPGCDRRYCAKCGNDDHGHSTCPPSSETLQWLDKNSKECPNCKNRIEKNGGCKFPFAFCLSLLDLGRDLFSVLPFSNLCMSFFPHIRRPYDLSSSRGLRVSVLVFLWLSLSQTQRTLWKEVSISRHGTIYVASSGSE